MRIVIQRVAHASVTIEGEVKSAIKQGYLVLLGIEESDTTEDIDWLVRKVIGLRVFDDENHVMKSNFYGQIGDVYYQLGNMEETYKAYDEALKFNENNAFVLNNYSYFLTLDKKDLKKAERMAALCIKLEPDNATYIDTYAWVFFMEGNYSLAKIYIENALSKDKTNSAELVDHYGDILYMSGEKEKAIEQWKKAKEMGKESTILDEKIAKGEYIEDTTEKKE